MPMLFAEVSLDLAQSRLEPACRYRRTTDMGSRSFFSALAVSCALFSACASAPPPEAISAADLFRNCRNLRFDGPVDEDLVLEPIPDDVKQSLDEEIERIGAEDIGTDVVQWFLVSRTGEEISIGHKRPNGDADSYTEGHLRLTDQGWRGGGWGPCEVRFGADERQSLRWTLETTVDPNDPVISLLATEQSCGSDPPLETYSIQPLLVSTSERMTIVLVARLPSDPDEGSCREAQPQWIEIDLGEPLGDRELHDGGARSIGSQRYPSSS
jgi:hypothetical protein